MNLFNKNLLFFYSLLVFLPQCKSEDPSKPVTPTDTTKTNTTFTNPILPSGPDPWVFQKDNNYYYTHTLGNRIGIIKTKVISDIRKTTFKTVWTPPVTGAYSKNIWAPEIHRIHDKWYFYFAADDGHDVNHRMYVLENASVDPTEGTWEFKGKISDTDDKWAIDGSVFNYNNIDYFIWSGWKGLNDPGRQQLYIAKMSNPWTLEGTRVMISEPTYSWEKHGDVNEGPEALIHNGRLFIVFSASGCWTDNYSLGLLTLKEGGDPLNPTDWTKSPSPLFSTNASNNAFAPGHNGFFKSPDGSEDWIIYHANSTSGQGCGNTRNPRAQKFIWNSDGFPEFGEPVKTNTPIERPSGEVSK